MNKNEPPRETANPGPAAAAAAAATGGLRSLADQVATLERQALDRMKTSMQEATRLYVDALDYAAALSAHWRSFALDAVKRVSDTPVR